MRNVIKITSTITFCILLMACGVHHEDYFFVDNSIYNDDELPFCIEETEKEPWQIAFAPIVNAYAEAWQSRWLYYDEYLIGNSSVVQLALGANLSGVLVYGFHDLNGNGIPELILGTNSGDAFIHIHEIYTIQDGKPIALFQSGLRIHRWLSVDNDGNHIIRFVWGRFDYWAATLYRFDMNGELIFIAEINTFMALICDDNHSMGTGIAYGDECLGCVHFFGHLKTTDNYARLNSDWDSWEQPTCEELLEWLAKHGIGRFWPDGSRDENEISSREPAIDWKPLLS